MKMIKPCAHFIRTYAVHGQQSYTQYMGGKRIRFPYEIHTHCGHIRELRNTSAKHELTGCGYR